MALKWNQFAGSDYYRKLPEAEQGAARRRFFDDQVAPRYSAEQREGAWADFDRRATMMPATVATPAQAPASIQRPQANVAARAAVAPPVAEQAAMPQRPVRPGQVQPAAAEPAIAAPAGGAGFVEGMKDFGRTAVKSVVQGIPEAAANLADYIDTPEFDASGRQISDDGALSKWARATRAAAEKRGEPWQESTFGQEARAKDDMSWRGGAGAAGESMGLSWGPGLAGAAAGAAIGSMAGGVGAIPGAAAGYAIGSLATLPLFFGAQAKDTYDRVFKQAKIDNPELDDESAHDKAVVAGGFTGLIEAAGERVSDIVGGKLFRLMPPGVKNGMVRAATKSFQGVRSMIADMLKIVGTEVGTELAQGASQSAVEASYGVGEGPTWQNQKGVIVPTIIMSLVGGGAAQGVSAAARYRTAKLLQDPARDPEQRLIAARNVAGAIHQQDPELAKLFLGEAQNLIAARKPVIAEGDQFYRDLKPLAQREEDQRMAAGEDMPSEEARTAAFGEAPADVPRGTEIPPEAFAQPEGAEAADTLATDENGDIIIEDGGEPTPPPDIQLGRTDAPIAGELYNEGDTTDPVTGARVPGVAPPTEQPITDAAAVAPPQEPQAVEPAPLAAPAENGSTLQGEMVEPLNPEARKQHMNAIGANLKVLRAEREAAKKAGDEALMAEVDDEIQATAVNFKRLANNQAPLPTPREQTAGSAQNLGQDPAQNLGLAPGAPAPEPAQPAAALPKNDGIDLADEQPVKALDDARMQDPDFRNWMEQAVGGLVSVKDGNLGLAVDPNFIKGESDRGDEVRMVRAGSVNPPWFQEIAAAENVSVDGLRGIVKKAMTGAKLGVRQDRAVRKLMDAITDERIGELQDWGRGLGMSAEEVAGLHNDNPVAHMRALEAEVSARQKKAADAEVEQQWAEQDAVVAGKKAFTPDVVLGEDAPDVDGYDFSDQEAIEGHVYATAVGWGVPVAQLDELHAQAPDAESFLSSVRNAIREIRANEKIRSDQGEAGSVADIGGPGAPESGESAAAEAERLAALEQARAEAIPALEEYLGTDWRKDGERRARLAAASPDELVEEVYRDKMTGLLNKRAWNEDVVKAGFEKEGRRSKPSAIVYIDLDGLKFLNDEMGHAAGDELLANFGAAMKAAGIDGYHISGDEFGAIFENEADASEAMDRLQREVESSVVRGKSKDGRGITNTGIAFSYGLGGSANSADMAMQDNKKAREAQGLRTRGGMPSTAAYDEESVLQPYDQAAIDAKAAEDKARAKKDADAAAKQKADDERGDFVLAGSARPADQAAARGAQDMFSGGGEAPAAPKAKPSANTIFTEDAAEKARAVLRAKLGQVSTGIDPEIVQAGITLAGYHIEKGARSFSAYAKAMLGDLGDIVRPYLKSWYVAISLDPRAAAFDGMDSYDAVKAVDVDAITSAPESDPINAAAHEAATSPQNDTPHPTEGQKEAGNYKKGHVTWNGLDITIENPAGSKRRPEWPTLQSHYGYLKRTEGADGEHVDVFINPDENRADTVFVIDQLNGGKAGAGFDEHKVMLGFKDKGAAIAAYKGNYTKGWHVGPVTEMSVDEFKAWLKDGDSTKPVADAPAKAVGPSYKPGQIIRANIDGKPEYVVVRNEWTDAERGRGEPISVRTQAMVARVVEIQESDVLPDETPAAADEHAGKWFGSKDKALQYLAKKKIGATHTIAQSGTRFEIQPKGGSADALAPGSAQAYAGETPATENNDAKRPVDQPGAGALAGKPAAAVRPAEEGGGTGTGAAGSGSGNAGGTGNAAGAGAGLASGVGNGAGAVPVSASGAASVGAGPAELDLFGVRGPAAAEAAASPGGRGDAPALVAPAQLSPDFVITDDVDLGGGGEKTKYRRNVDAIRLLNTLESEGRYATADEQRTLALYVGWGGLQGAFDPNNEKWAKEYAELKELMTLEEYAEAAQSTQYAHYTSKEIIGGIYGALERMGFTGGKVLEAGGGVGNFIGLMPDAMRTAGRFTLVERERIAAGIAKHLYPQQSVQKADFAAFGRGADGQYDVAAGNPPFSRTALSDQSGRKHLSGLRIHNYFIAKEIDLLRPGGILINVVSNGFLDAADSRARDYIAGRAKFLGAIRLPNNAFSKNAGTEVTTDIVFFQKLPESEWGSRAAKKDAERWTTLGRMPSANGGEKIPTNIYFVNNPQMMLGNWGRFGSMYRADQPALVAKPGQNTALDLAARLLDLPANIYQPAAVTGTQNIVDAAVVALNNPTVSEGGFYLQDGKLFERLPDNAGQAYGRALTPASKWTEKTLLGKSGHDRLVALVNLRGTLRSLLAAEMADDQKAMDRLRAQLNTQYDAYAKDALLNDPGTTRYFGDDPDYPLLASLELDYKPGVGAAAAKKAGISPFKSSAKKAAIFTRRVVDHRKPVSKADSPQDALNISLAERGVIDADYIGKLLGKDPQSVLEELAFGEKPLLFMDPATNEYVLRDEYLSGNVRRKLAQARQSGMMANARALEQVQPEDVGAGEISARIGSPWVPPTIYADFAKSILGAGTKAILQYVPFDSSFTGYIEAGSRVADTSTYGTKDYEASRLIYSMLNNREIKVTYTDSDGKTHTDKEGTELARDKAQEIREKFQDWLFADSDRAELLVRAYNDANNNYVTRVFDGSWLTFPGKVPDEIIKFRRHQRNFVARVMQTRTALADHVVGAGKTYSAIAAAMELKRTGLAKKPMIVVPNHLVKQWATDFYRLYPGANILTATKKDFERVNRRRFLGKIATGDWDAVIIAHSSFNFIKPDPAFEEEFTKAEVKELMDLIAQIEKADDSKENKRKVKQLQSQQERLENKLKSLREKPVDDMLDFEQLGVDQLFVDEAHLFKNLMFSTKMQNIRGLGDAKGSQRAFDMFIKVNETFRKNGRGQGVVFLTGTPVSNSLAEMYHMMRYLMPDQMREAKFWPFDAWANTYASIEETLKPKTSGNGYKTVTAFGAFTNTFELLKMFDQVSDTVTMDDIKSAYSEENGGAEFPLPKVKTGRRQPVAMEMSEAQSAYMEDIARRAEALEQRKGPPQKGEDNHLKVMGDARKAALDVRLVDTTVTEREKGARLDRAAGEIHARYTQFEAERGTQLVFSDLGTPIKSAKKELEKYQALQERITRAADPKVQQDAALGDDAAIDIMNDAEEAQAEIDEQGSDWLDGIKAALRGFSVYDDLKAALIERGIPEAQIAFIHDFNTDDQKAGLFRKVKDGTIRVLMGSTPKLGAGTNVQDRLVALHHIDIPWKPSDVEQREGRIIRQGNLLSMPKLADGTPNPDYIDGFEVEILAYVTKDTLDKNMWDIQERKLRGINQLRSRQISREIENSFDEMEMSASEMQAAATGNVDLLREIQLRNDIQKLERKKRGFDAQQADRDNRRKRAQQLIATLPADIALAEKADAYAKEYRDSLQKMQDEFTVTIDGTEYTDWKKAGLYLREQVDKTITDESGKEKPAPLNVTINGEKYTNRTKMTEAFTELRGDADPVIWEVDGTTLRRRNAIEKAIRQRVADALAEQTEQPIGRIGQYDVAIEGDGLEAVNVTMKAPGGIETGMKLSVPKVDPEDAARIAGTSIVRAAANHAIAAGEATWRKNLLKNAQRDLTELGEAGAKASWPDMPKLEAARAEHKAIIERIKAGGWKPPKGWDVANEDVGAGGVYGFYSRGTPAAGHTDAALYARLRDLFGEKFMAALFQTGKFRVINSADAARILGPDALRSTDDLLSTYTEGDIQGQSEQAKAEKKRAEKEAAKRAADEQRDGFVLTGSNSTADQAAARGQGSLFSTNGSVRGFFNPADGITYLVADNIPAGFTDAQIRGLMTHEIGVHALNAGRDSAGWQNILSEIDRLIEAKDAQALAARDRAIAAKTPQENMRDEIAGYLVEDAPNTSIVRQILAWFKAQIMRLTKFNVKLTAADITEMARAALRNAPSALAARDSESVFALRGAIAQMSAEDDGRDIQFSRGAAPTGAPQRATNPVQGAMVPPAVPPVPPQQGALNVQGGATGPGATWSIQPLRWLDTVIYRLQDKQIDLKQVQQAIKAAGRQIGQAYDAYLKEEMFHGRAATRVKEFLEDDLDPLIADMRARGVSQEQLGQYLWARHAPEVNAHIATINPQMPDGGSGMTDAEAAAYMAGLTPQQQADFAALAARVDAITQGTRDMLVDYKLISAQDRMNLESLYQHYVPLYRENMDTMLHGMGTGQGYSVRGAETRRRVGSALPVVDILGNIANARDKAIVRGEKARVGRALYAMALTNKNPDFWRTAVAAPTIKTHDKNGMVVEVPDPMWKQRDNVVTIKVPTRRGNIVERAVIFNERDPRAARMARAIKNLDGQQLGEFLGATASVTRYFASINTQYNPIFGVVNLIRDVQTAMLNLSSTPLAGKQAAVAADMARIVAGAMKHGLRDFDGPWKAIAREFEEAGGMTGYRDMFRTGQERTEAIEKALDPNWWQKRPWGKALTANGYLKAPAELLADNGVRPVMEWLSDYNQVLENATRLAAYKQARDMGLSRDASASIAKNLTVNFNRKGEMALQLGALYAFFNAATQGIARMGQTFAGPAGKYIVGGGVLAGVLQAMLLAAAGYDDEEPPQFVRERALILPTPWNKDRYVSIPMPLGFHVLPNFGRLIVEAMRTGDLMGKTASMMGIMADAFNPLGGSAPVAQILSPTATDPFVALGMNKDWTGKPIAREDFSNLHPTPGFTRARDAAGAPARWLAKALNRLSGGTDYTQGLISPTPDQIEYLAGQLTGGIGREAIKASTTATSIVTGDELPMHKVPLIGRFYGSTEGQAPQANKFYANLKKLNEHGATVKGLRADRRNAEVMEYLRDNPDARLFEAAGKAERKVSELRARRRALAERDASKAELKRVDDLITAQMVQLNDRMKALSK